MLLVAAREPLKGPCRPCTAAAAPYRGLARRCRRTRRKEVARAGSTHCTQCGRCDKRPLREDDNEPVAKKVAQQPRTQQSGSNPGAAHPREASLGRAFG